MQNKNADKKLGLKGTQNLWLQTDPETFNKNLQTTLNIAAPIQTRKIAGKLQENSRR